MPSVTAILRVALDDDSLGGALVELLNTSALLGNALGRSLNTTLGETLGVAFGESRVWLLGRLLVAELGGLVGETLGEVFGLAVDGVTVRLVGLKVIGLAVDGVNVGCRLGEFVG
jgi:hypothetical protein